MASRLQFISISLEYLQQIWMVALARLFHELLLRDHEDGRATGLALHALRTTLDRAPSLSYNQMVTLNLENCLCCWKRYIIQS